jgi:hypothetical protein
MSPALNMSACPSFTTSLSSSTSKLDCRCMASYRCTYTKRIQATITLSTTAAAFTADTNAIKTNFLAAVAAAAGVPVAQVQVLQVTAGVGGSRRLLQAGPQITVTTLIQGSSGLLDLHKEMRRALRGNYMQGYDWKEAHWVHSHPSLL